MYGDIEQNRLCALATIIDPRFKLKCFSSAGNASHAREDAPDNRVRKLSDKVHSFCQKTSPSQSIQESILTLPLKVFEGEHTVMAH